MNAIDMAARTYAAKASPVRTDRGVEYEAFARTTRRLAEAAGPDKPLAQLAEALFENQRLWNLLSAASADDSNALPQELRARLFYLGEFTRQHSRSVLKREADADVLIEINRAVMRGLRSERGT